MPLHRKLVWIVIVLCIALGVWLLKVSRPGTAVRGCPQGCATDAQRLDGPLRVVSLNMLHGHPDFEHLESRRNLIADEILAIDADIVLLQEVPWTVALGDVAEYIAQRCGMNHVYLRSNGNRWAIFFEEGSAILSRYALKNTSLTELRPRAEFFEHRIALHATVVTDWGELDVFVTHLTDGEDEINQAQAEALQAFVQATGNAPAIVGGDFNAREDEAHMLELGAVWIDAYRSVHAADPGWTCCIDDLTSGPSEALEKRIDYVFVVPRAGTTVRVLNAEIVFDRPTPVDTGWLWPSDHLGLLIEIEMAP
jgi:endonuclease/exonuclease/phosphatase family metal-dependent hydrolase